MLIVALIMLLLISIIGVSAMQSTSMEERMAGNLYDRHTAFQAAEAALREGEAQFVSAYPDLSVVSGAISLQMNGRAVAATYQLEELESYESSLEAGAEVETTGMVVRVVAQSNGVSGERPVVLESTYVIEE
ncbi:Type IV fimbrial biogenesis protein PilX [Marinobacterium lacunae]|uniref:Type IV fimbrial biogenesis protein PilX n=1 Tax=Marinobacterium lacunae TaxID=1232683 RepID=A0A081G1D6_9GAMM|nr:Type IV fimbrial biogenesis protein PilX [Marinobacterium lacunae]